MLPFLRTCVFLAAAMLTVPRAAVAVTIWAETEDAGQALTTAQVPSGSGPLTTITGALSFTDVDVYQIYITGGGTFSAVAIPTDILFLDPELFLFDAQGFGVYANDNPFGGIGPSAQLPANHVLTPTTPGLYYLGVSTRFLEPISSSGNIFPCVGCTPGAVVGPTGPGGGSTLIGWSGMPFGAGAYQLTLTGAEFPPPTSIPEPGSLFLMSTGLAAFSVATWRRRQKRQTSSRWCRRTRR